MKKLALLAAASLVVAGLGAGVALAQDDPFLKADTNHDTFVDMTEAMGVYSTLTQAQFDQADANKDGKLDAAEFGSLQGLTATDQGNQASSSQAPSSSAAQ
jgi:hypothetical protein